MPIENGVGWGENTKDKQTDFSSLLSFHVELVDRMTRPINKRWKREYTYIDMNAGPGFYHDFVGSPITFLDRIEQTDIAYSGIFIEEQEVNAIALQSAIKSRNPRGHVKVINEESSIALRNGAMPTSKTYGMVYHDPTGNPNFELLSEISRSDRMSYIDFVVYLGATFLKRDRRSKEASGIDASNRLLINCLASINKKCWIIRKPQSKEQWTFIIGSNWVDFPAWESRGFYRVSSPAGKDILTRLSYTANEINEMSGQLSFFS